MIIGKFAAISENEINQIILFNIWIVDIQKCGFAEMEFKQKFQRNKFIRHYIQEIVDKKFFFCEIINDFDENVKLGHGRHSMVEPKSLSLQ